MEWSISALQQILSAELKGENLGQRISDILTDSRNAQRADKALFFCLKGPRHDGHDYISDLIRKGIKVFVVEKSKKVNKVDGVLFLEVNNTTQALQDLAAHHRSQFNYPVIAVTGSNGKTIVKEWLYQLLRFDHNIVRSPKSFNSQIGVPLSVLAMREEHDLAILEAGISQAGEMQKLQAIIQPTLGVFTNIGEAHSENFASGELQTLEKAALFKECKKIVFCDDHALISKALSAAHSKDQLLSWSRTNNGDLNVEQIISDETGTNIKTHWKGEGFTYRIPFTDQASIENSLHCILVLLQLGKTPEIIAERLQWLTPIEMRLEVMDGVNNSLILNDSYNSDIASLSIALDFLNQQRRNSERTLILSDILQDRSTDEELYKKVAHLIQLKGIRHFIGIGEQLSHYRNYFPKGARFYNSTEDFLSTLNDAEFSEQNILIKGARNFQFERIARRLQQKDHETVLEIDLDALAHNLHFFRSKLKPETQLMVMVKAFAYGSGSHEVAALLEHNRADQLAVAYADEGVELRRAGITLPIMVMNPERRSFETMLFYRLDPEIYSFQLLKEWIDFTDNRSSAIHIKVDTGMRRLGFEIEDAERVAELINTQKNLTIRSVFSHLAAADMEEEDAFTHLQAERLITFCDGIKELCSQDFLIHLLNTAGVQRFPEYQFNMVRLGIGLYGVSQTTEEQRFLKPASSLKTIISQIKEVHPCESVGYCRTDRSERSRHIAVLPIGYADGFRRSLSNGKGKVFIAGKAAPVVGKVCMDMTMVDVTHIPEAREGDEVIVFGKDHPVHDFAADMDTIAYEALTGISGRVKRLFVREG